MTTSVVYTPQDGDPVSTEWWGIKFQANVPVDLDERKYPEMMESIKGNPYFDIKGNEKKRGAKASAPTTPAEYKTYAIAWVLEAASTDEVSSRWDKEKALRSKVGWGSDDDDGIRPIIQPHIDALKEAEEHH